MSKSRDIEDEYEGEYSYKDERNRYTLEEMFPRVSVNIGYNMVCLLSYRELLTGIPDDDDDENIIWKYIENDEFQSLLNLYGVEEYIYIYKLLYFEKQYEKCEKMILIAKKNNELIESQDL